MARGWKRVHLRSGHSCWLILPSAAVRNIRTVDFTIGSASLRDEQRKLVFVRASFFRGSAKSRWNSMATQS